MLISRVLSVVVLAATALADVQAIAKAIEDINEKTTSLEEAVVNYKTFFDWGPIGMRTLRLLDAVDKGHKLVKEEEALTPKDVIKLLRPTTDLSVSVMSTLKNLIAAKEKFKPKIFTNPIIYANLVLQRKATREFSKTLLEKIPEKSRGLAKTQIDPLAEAFDEAVEIYRPFYIPK